jgi:hypothetical protein
VYYECIAVFTLDAGLLAGSQYTEGPTTGLLDTGLSCFVGLEANAEVLPNFPLPLHASHVALLT